MLESLGFLAVLIFALWLNRWDQRRQRRNMAKRYKHLFSNAELHVLADYGSSAAKDALEMKHDA